MTSSNSKRLGLRLRLVLLFSLTAAVVLTLFSLWSYRQNRDETVNHLETELISDTEESVREISAWFQTRIVALETMSRFLTAPGVLDQVIAAGADDNPLLKPFIGLHGLDPYIGFPDLPPYYGGDWPEPEGYDATGRPWYRAAAEQQSTTFSDYYIDSETKGLTMTLTTPLIGPSGNLRGVLATDLLLETVMETLYAYKMEGGSLIMLDEQGVILAHGDKDLINSPGREGPLGETVEAMLASGSGSANFVIDGRNNRMVYRTIPATGWVIGFYVDQGIAFHSLKLLARLYLAISAAVILLFALLSYFTAGFITRSMSFVSRSLYEIAQGGGDLTVSLPVKSRDEIGELSQNFNDFVAKIRELILQVKESSAATTEHKNGLAANTEEVGAAIAEINANLNAMKKQIETLNSSVHKNVDSSEVITTYIQDFDKQMDEQATMVEQTSAAINEMTASLGSISRTSENKRAVAQELIDKARNGSELMEATNRSFKEGVVSRVESIRNVTQLIKGITGQINLLSMNAAIEAAHAGDAGRGFSVVAEEIRKLAESSSESVKNIETTIKEINASVQDTADNAAATTRSFTEINSAVSDFTEALAEITHSTAELVTGSQEIQSSASALQDITTNVKSGSGNIRNQIESMNSEMEQVSNITRTVTSGIQEAVAGSQEIVTSSTQTTDILSQLETSTEKLNQELGRFKT